MLLLPAAAAAATAAARPGRSAHQMGVGFSTFSNGVFVQCDTREYVAGDVVRAVVALHVGGAPLDLFAMHLEVGERGCCCLCRPK